MHVTVLELQLSPREGILQLHLKPGKIIPVRLSYLRRILGTPQVTTPPIHKLLQVISKQMHDTTMPWKRDVHATPRDSLEHVRQMLGVRLGRFLTTEAERAHIMC